MTNSQWIFKKNHLVKFIHTAPKNSGKQGNGQKQGNHGLYKKKITMVPCKISKKFRTIFAGKGDKPPNSGKPGLNRPPNLDKPGRSKAPTSGKPPTSGNPGQNRPPIFGQHDRDHDRDHNRHPSIPQTSARPPTAGNPPIKQTSAKPPISGNPDQNRPPIFGQHDRDRDRDRDHDRDDRRDNPIRG